MGDVYDRYNRDLIQSGCTNMMQDMHNSTSVLDHMQPAGTNPIHRESFKKLWNVNR